MGGLYDDGDGSDGFIKSIRSPVSRNDALREVEQLAQAMATKPQRKGSN